MSGFHVAEFNKIRGLNYMLALAYLTLKGIRVNTPNTLNIYESEISGFLLPCTVEPICHPRGTVNLKPLQAI